MQKTNIQPILNESALFLKDIKTIVVADLHIGIEKELRESGLQTSSQTSNMTNRLISIFKIYKPKEIFLLGDIKHNIPTSTIQERNDVKLFLKTIKNYGQIHIIPGNHDGNIGKLIDEEILLHPSDGFVFENLGFVHGHRWPKQEIVGCKTVIVAHTHPTIMFSDRLGYKTFEPCWVRGKLNSLEDRYTNIKNNDFIMLPAFNPLCGGIAVNKDNIIGPFKKIIEISSSDVYLLDGSYLGKVKDIN